MKASSRKVMRMLSGLSAAPTRGGASSPPGSPRGSDPEEADDHVGPPRGHFHSTFDHIVEEEPGAPDYNASAGLSAGLRSFSAPVSPGPDERIPRPRRQEDGPVLHQV